MTDSRDSAPPPADQPGPNRSPSDIPPFEEDAGTPRGFRAIAQLFLVPAAIVAVAVGVFLAMNFLTSDKTSPEDILHKVATGDSRRRGQAAFELSKRIAADPAILQDPSFRAQLLAIYERSEGDGVELRRYLTRVLSLAEMPEAVPALLRATHDEDSQTRLYAVVALGNARTPAAFDRLAELTQDEDPGIRSVAVAALGALGDSAAVPILQARLSDGAAEVAWNAANALAHLGSDAGQELLVKMLDVGYLSSQPGITQEQTQQAMLMAVEGLAQLERRSSSEERRAALEQAAHQAPFPRVQDAALRALRGERGS
jgi:HEAT repeat protein